MQKIWNIVKPNLKIQTELSRDLGISKVLAQLLLNRGITESKTAAEFLNPCLTHLLSPDYLPDISLTSYQSLHEYDRLIAL